MVKLLTRGKIILLSTLFSCNNVNSQNTKVDISDREIKTDSIQVSISEDYQLIIKTSFNESEKINFFEPIIEDLKKEKTFAQIIYDKNNVIINIEIGNNADGYEDYYLSKINPIIIERIVRTTINKADHLEKTECEKILNMPISISFRYSKIENSSMKCHNSKQD